MKDPDWFDQLITATAEEQIRIRELVPRLYRGIASDQEKAEWEQIRSAWRTRAQIRQSKGQSKA
jgi:hypothetical protein